MTTRQALRDAEQASNGAGDQPAFAKLPADLAEAEDILTQLAAVFFPTAAERQPAYSELAQRWTSQPGVDDVWPDVGARYRILVEQIPAVVFMAFLDQGIGEAYVSPQIEAVLGFTQEEWLNDPVRWYQQIHPDDKARWSVEAAQIFLTGQPLRSIYRVLARDGRTVWFHCEVRMVRHEGGRPWFLHGVGFDITELKRTEEALRESEQMLRSLTASLLSAQDKERRRIARELHDGTAQNLAGLSMNLSLLMNSQVTAGDPRLHRILSDSLALTEECSREVRNLSYLLHPPLLDDLGLASALKSFISGFSQRTGIQVELEIPPSLGRLAPEVELTIFRIVQEGLANIHRHSGSPRAAIRVSLTDTEVRLEMEDEGSGQASKSKEEGAAGLGRLGVGIPGMRERARQLGGQTVIESNSGGTIVAVTLPRRSPS